MVKLRCQPSDDFLKEEIRNGYLVTERMKEVWAVELDLLIKLLEVCQKYHLKIYADGGTLLGAIREHGFIPWDDDMDLVMPRYDYDVLCQVAKEEFKFPYFFQSYRTEKWYPRRHAQLRNSQTTAVLKSELEIAYSFNQGIFIDIFVLDGFQDNEILRIKQKRKGERLQKLINFKCNHKSKNRIAYYACKFIPWCILIKQMDRTLTKQNYNNSEFVVNYGFSFDIGVNVTKRYRRFYDEDPVYVPFEHTTIPVPKHYHEWLSLRYGDYMRPSQSGAVHSGVIFDTDISYLDYFKKGV